MSKQILVTYASKYGSTAQIADRISKILADSGFDVTEGPIESAANPTGFDAVIAGSAVYAGQWRQEAGDWLRSHSRELAECPTWLFSSGPTGEGNPVQLMDGWRFPENLLEVAERVDPLDIAFFHGNIDPSKLNFGEKMIVKALKAPTGDFRDWEAIEGWAERIAVSLNGEKATELR